MKKRIWVIAGIVLGVTSLWVLLIAQHHPDTSSFASYGPYTRLLYDAAPAWSSDGTRIVFSRAPQGSAFSLWSAAANGSSAAQFMTDAALPAWSRDGNFLAFSAGGGETWYDLRRFLPGKPIHIWIADANGHNRRRVTTTRETDLDPAWSPDGKRIAFTAFPGPRVMVIDRFGGEALQIANGMSPAWSPDGKRLAYFECESMYLGATCRVAVKWLDSAETRTLHSSATPLGSVGRPSVDWAADGRRLLSTQMENGSRIPVAIDVEQDRVVQKFPVSGSAVFARWSPDGDRIAYALTDTAHPPAIEILTVATGQRTQIGPPPRRTAAELVRIRASDNLEIPSWLYVPTDHSIRHPAIVWLHGGAPGTGSMPNQFDNAIQYFVENGFVVLAPNYRGSIGFGDDLARVYQGMDPLPDVFTAVNYVKTLHSVDPARVALLGFSFGGFLTLRAIAAHPNLVAAGVNFFGPSDLGAYYHNHPEARPMLASLLGGSPEQKPEVFRALSPINFVASIKSPLLVLFGTRDPDYDEALELRKALKREHKDFEYLAYHFASHGFEGADDVDANQQTMKFLLARLGRVH